MRTTTVAATIAALLALAGCAPAGPMEVEYSVTGSAEAVSLTIQNGQGGTEQMQASLPWTKSLTVEPGSFLYVSAQNAGQAGSVTCEITVDGQTFKQSTSTGPHVIASCSGAAGQP